MPIDPGLSGPKFVQLFDPVLEALRKLGGSARPPEVRDEVADALALSEEERSDLLDSGTSRFDNFVNWARFYLVKADLIDASRRGVWSLTETGRNTRYASHDQAMDMFREVHGRFAKNKPQPKEPDPGSVGPAPEDNDDHRRQLLAMLLGLPPDGFERFCQRLLRESDFQEVKVTGRSGDGGIDGIGILQVNALVSFKVVFQCKRYQGSVGSALIRDFRGAMMGRADKGIVITTGTFTSEARKESVRDGVPPIELVDGQKLIEMMESLELGLTPVRSYEVDTKFFDEFQ